MRTCLCFCLLLPLSLAAAERKFDLSGVAENQPPPGFRSAVTGTGKPGDWRVVLDDVSSGLVQNAPAAHGVVKKAVLAQLAQDPADEHFPLLIYDPETYGDFKLSTRFKTVSGKVEQMAGIAFHIQNETNYYVVRASTLGNTFRFYKVLDGQRGPLVGPELPISSGAWHDLQVECQGNQIKCSLDGRELISVTDRVNPFTSGKIGFWTKSDAVSYFADPKITYVLREAPAQALVRDVLKKYPRVLDLQIYVRGNDSKIPKMIAGKVETEIGKGGGEAERSVLENAGTYYGKDKAVVTIVMPLRDRNGECVAAARVMMKTSLGQTEQNALARAGPVVKSIQARVQSAQDLID